MKRKILTLEEVLNLDRCPTLQKMVDLTIEDYAMYLYKKGIIEREPSWENYDFGIDEEEGYTYFVYENDNYDTVLDDVNGIIYPDYEPLYDRTKSPLLNDGRAPADYLELWDVPDNFNLQKSKEWNTSNIIEKGTIYSKHWGSIEYSIDNKTIITLYEKNLDGKYWNPTVCNDTNLYYLKHYYDKQRTSDRKVEI